MDAERIKYVNLGSFRSSGSLYLGDTTILLSSKITQSVLLDAGIPAGLFSIYGATDETGKFLVLCVSFTEHILYQSGRYSSNFCTRFPSAKDAVMPIF